MRTSSLVSGFLLPAVLAAPAAAHKPIFSDGTALSPETAIRIDDVSISYVIYHEVTEPGRPLWLVFDVAAGQRVYLSLGVPVLEGSESLRPSLALLGPGLPPVELPFEIPAGLGGLVLQRPEGREPEFFHEEFTGTDSWIQGEIEPQLEQAGTYYAVAWLPDGATGKLWVAPGRREAFTLADVVGLPATIARVRAFHELSEPYFPCFLAFLGAAVPVLWGARLMRRRRLSCPAVCPTQSKPARSVTGGTWRPPSARSSGC